MASGLMAKSVESKITGLIAADVDAAGYELVRVLIVGGGKYATLQIMAERKDGGGMTVDDCATISHKVSEMIEADSELAERYGLEVSSPGIDRPLVKLQDYARFQGHVAKVEVGTPVDGQRRFQGAIAGVEGETVGIETDKGVVWLPFEAVEKAKLVLTDALLKAAARGDITH